MDNRTPLLEIKHISKVFPGVKALDDISFSIMPGEVHALAGENGAGKIDVDEDHHGSVSGNIGGNMV